MPLPELQVYTERGRCVENLSVLSKEPEAIFLILSPRLLPRMHQVAVFNGDVTLKLFVFASFVLSFIPVVFLLILPPPE